MSIVVVGSVAYDTVETPREKRERQLGGSASFFVVAARGRGAVRCVGVVGDDFRQSDLDLLVAHGGDVTGITRAPGKSFHWSGRYHDDMIERDTLATDLGVFADFQPEIPAAWRDSEYLFLANIHPALQMHVLNEMTGPKLVALDTMNLWIDIARDDLVKILSRVDILFVHDLDVANHKTQEVVDQHVDVLMQGGYKALVKLRDEGTIKAFGAGLNEWQTCQVMAERGDFDLFLLAGRYTLLEQEALETFLPLVESRGIGIITGGPYNSGILATGPVEGAWYNYDPASPEILDRVARIQKVCESHNVRMVDAAFKFPLHHPSTLSVIPGGQGVSEMKSNIAAARAHIPYTLWSDLKEQGLMREDAPV